MTPARAPSSTRWQPFLRRACGWLFLLGGVAVVVALPLTGPTGPQLVARVVTAAGAVGVLAQSLEIALVLAGVAHAPLPSDLRPSWFALAQSFTPLAGLPYLWARTRKAPAPGPSTGA